MLLGAGVDPLSAWRHLAEAGVHARSATEVVDAVAQGHDVPDAIVRAAPADARAPAALLAGWRALAAAWWVSAAAGAPLGPTLRDVAAGLRSLAAADRAVQLALASPRATARVVLVLPVVGLLFGAVLGFDTIGVLVGTPIGIGCLVVGAALMLVAWRWNARLVRAAAPTDASRGIACDLVAIGIAAGAPVSRARAAAASALERFALDDGIEQTDEVLALSERAGVPAVELLRATADEQRAQSAAQAQRAAERLGVTLLLPLGVCVLPAFIVLGVVPMLVAVVTSTVAVL